MMLCGIAIHGRIERRTRLMKKGEDEGGIVFMVGVCAYAAIK